MHHLVTLSEMIPNTSQVSMSDALSDSAVGRMQMCDVRSTLDIRGPTDKM